MLLWDQLTSGVGGKRAYVEGYIDVKKRFYVFYFGHAFTFCNVFFIFSTFFIYKKR